MPTHNYILLPDHTIKDVSLKEWLKRNDKKQRDSWRVGRTIIKDTTVSTVFLGLDHSFGEKGPPILFESMIFGDEKYNEYQERYHTWDEADAGHKKLCTLVRPTHWMPRFLFKLLYKDFIY